MARPVSQILLEDCSLTLRPGHKGECPQCHHATFSLKGDDTLGKCFHPSCAYFLTAETGETATRRGLAPILDTIASDCHGELLRLATGQRNAYTYLRDERGIHPQVIQHARLGAIPAGYDVAALFQAALAEAEAALTPAKTPKVGRPSRKPLEQAEARFTWLQTQQQKLVECFAHRAGWLVFVYEDAAHRPVALRLREPYAKRFVSFKPGHAGLFGRELFTPYRSPAHQGANEDLLVVEGEFNALQLQSLTVRYEETTGQPLGYVNVCAVGGVLTADGETIKRVADHPVVVYDHDTNEAGFELVKRLQAVMPLEACTTPLTWGDKSDLDSFITDFEADHVGAWEGVKQLIADRQAYGRVYSGTGEEFFDYPVNGKTLVFVPKLLGDALLAQATYRYAAEQLWIYQDGYYRPCGTSMLRSDAQSLLGHERREDRMSEALHYVEVAARIEEDAGPDTAYLNLSNGRLCWKTGTLAPHTAAVFTTIQLPVAYDPDATCPAFDQYVVSTFDADVAPLIEEVLGWCLKPDHRFEQAVMLTGEGENGKSVFLDLLGYLLGRDNVANVALHDLEENRFRAAELYGKLANIFADLDTRGLKSSSMFKTLTTGDEVTAERKHAQPFRFRSYAKLLFSANTIPSSRDRSHAFYRRWLFIPFTRTFDGMNGNPAPDKTLREKLQAELPGILNRALAGLARLEANEAFSQPKCVIETKNAYIRSNDNVRVFVEECVIPDKNGTIVKKEFRRVYKNWCDRYGESDVSDKELKKVLTKIIPGLDEWRPTAKAPWDWVGMMWGPDASDYM
jgi:putative DNA primase/helicase